MQYQEFFYAMQNLKDFFNEQQKLKDVLNVISPTGTSTIEFGSKFIDDYIDVIETALGDKNNSVSWFVFENNFGKNKLKAGKSGKAKRICNEHEFYDMVTNINQKIK